MKTYKITKKVIGIKEYLVVELEQGTTINEYHFRMIEKNVIFGIFPIKKEEKYGVTTLNYPIEQRFLLLNLLKQKTIGSKEVKIIYKKLIEAIMGMGEYFLNANQCIYDINYLYVDTTLNPYFIYIPVEEYGVTEVNRVWRDFFLELLSYASEGQQDDFYNEWMRFLIQPNFTLLSFHEFLQEKEEHISWSIQQAEKEIPVEYSKEVQEQTEQKVSKSFFVPSSLKKEKKDVVEEPQKQILNSGKNNILIPGMPPVAATVEEGEDEPIKEKKSFFSFGKKKKEKVEKISKKENIVVPSNVENTKKEIPKVQELQGTEWSSKTVFITPPDVEDGRTVMVEEPAYLMHGEVYIPLLQFPFTIGRLNTNYIINNPTITKTHATIFKQNGVVMIQDEDSSNGTYIDGEKLPKYEPVPLKNGSHIRLSKEEFTYHE